MPAVADGLSNLSEIAVAEIVEKFLKRASDLEPRVSPCVGAIDVLLKVGVFYHMDWVA